VINPTPRIQLLLARASAWCFGAIALGTVLYCAHILLGLGGGSLSGVLDDGLYNAVLLGSAIAVLMRAFSRGADRGALLFIGAGMLAWALGELSYTVLYSSAESAPTPSIDDAFYLAFYPLVFIGLGLLIRARHRGLGAAMWLDGLIAGLGLAAAAAGLVLGPILSSTGGNLAVVATNLAYPVGDLLLFLVVVTGIGLMGWRPGWMWGLLALSLTLQVAADTIYLFQIATDAYVENTWLDTLWPLASVVMLAAMWVPAAPAGRSREGGWRSLFVPSIGVLSAVALLFVDHGSIKINNPARYLALATLLAAALRVALAFRESGRRQQESHVQAVTDELTGLWNRRMLIEDLDRALALATVAEPRLLFLYDLNGFKAYNDNFGHPAGDALLERLGGNLAATVGPYGRAYRMGGDEFCALLAPGTTPIEVLASATARALQEAGDGFEITAAQGMAMLPGDAQDASTALQLADRRLYAQKEGRPVGVTRQLRSVLLEILGARMPALADHLDDVAGLAHAVGRRMRLEPEAIDVLVRAAEMHDVGKTAIPETILNKPGPLDAGEWAFMRRHTIFGERILSAAPALAPVAKLVRSSHERWDGGGYPDGLTGEDIPLGSRIIFACDAFDAIVSQRTYKEARSPEEAISELRRCAGTQFDPRVVDALSAVLIDGRESAQHEDGLLEQEGLPRLHANGRVSSRASGPPSLGSDGQAAAASARPGS